jgi:8-oxo-dGTP pyrophosphatase MutT (NUDIX family)/inosine/xanthosine triphosphate pyrophosphatase family protein
MSQTELKLLLATHNAAKIERYKLLLKKISENLKREIQVFSPQDLGLGKVEVIEDGQNEAQNAYKKAKTYWETLPLDKKMPCLAMDTGCYFEGVLPDEQPGQMVRRITGKGENATDQDLVDFYKELCQKYGREINGYYLDTHCIYFGQANKVNKTGLQENYYKFDLSYPTASSVDFTEVVLENTDKRKILMTDQVVGELIPGFPMMSMYKFAISGKYHAEISPEEYLLEMAPITYAVEELLESVPDENTYILGKYEPNMSVRRRSLAVLKVDSEKYLGFIKLSGSDTSHPDLLTWAGGGVDPGETPSEAVLRELLEELGYTDLKLIKELGGKIIHYFVGDIYRVASVTYGFEVEILDINKRQKAEIDDGFYKTQIITKEEFLGKCEIEVAREFLLRV